MKFNFDLIKKHPYITGGVVLVGGLLIYAVMSSGSSSGATVTTTSSGVDPTTAAELAETEQTNQDQITAANNQDQFNLAYLQQQQVLQNNEDTESYNLSIANLGDQLTVAQQTLATNAAVSEYTTAAQTQVQNQELQTQLDINTNNNATALAQQQALAQEQEFTIAQQTALQTTISNNQTLVQQGQTQATVSIAGIEGQVQTAIAGDQASVAKTQSTNGLLGGLLSIF